MKYNKIIIVGMPGCGKTTISKKLADITKLPLFDTDSIFECKYGKISEFFKNKGENAFRIIEEELLAKCAQNQNYIISTGGGIVLSNNNRNLIFSNDSICSIYLEASIKSLNERISGNTLRPLLDCNNQEKKLRILLNTREKFYNLAKYKIPTDNRTIISITNEIIEKII